MLHLIGDQQSKYAIELELSKFTSNFVPLKIGKMYEKNKIDDKFHFYVNKLIY